MLTTFALEAKKKGTVKAESFTVTPEMRQQVYQRLRAKGITITPEVFNGAERLIDEQLGYEIARYVFGRPAEFRRRAAQRSPDADRDGSAAEGADPEGAAGPRHRQQGRRAGPN